MNSLGQALTMAAKHLSSEAATGLGSGGSCSRRLRLALRWFCWSLLVLLPGGLAAAPRITVWNLQETTASATNRSAPSTAEGRIQMAAAALQKLSPDIIILQEVRDWQMSLDLAAALRPAEYSVQVCSSFKNPRTSTAAEHQVAILSKPKAYFSWWESWRGGEPSIQGGFAFAAFKLGNRRVGVFAAEFGNGLLDGEAGVSETGATRARALCLQQWTRQVDAFRNWVTNRIEAAVVAGIFDSADPSRSLEERRIADALLGAPFQQLLAPPASAKTADNYSLARMVPDATVLPGVILDRSPATCDLEFTVAKQGSGVTDRSDIAPAKSDATSAQAEQAEAQSKPVHAEQPAASTETVPAAQSGQSSTEQTLTRPGKVQALVAEYGFQWLAGGVVALQLFILLWMLGRRRPGLEPVGPTLIAFESERGGGGSVSEAMVITPKSVSGSAADGPGGPVPAHPVVHVETSGAGSSQTEEWRRRALAAEQRAERATAIVRDGMMPQLGRWLKQKLVRKLVADRSELLETQQAAAFKAIAVDERLSRIELKIQEQTAAYERRIDELARELAVAKEENRELIRAKIAQVKAEMAAARARVLQQAAEREGC
jgi:hypothetical protein